MNILLWSVGGKHESYVKEGLEDFTQRINRYYPCEWKIVPPPKNAAVMAEEDQKAAESKALLTAIPPTDFLVLLDERGKMLSSPKLAEMIGAKGLNGTKRIHFAIGGAFGVTEELRKRAGFVWQLSQLVFPHQLVRLILAEQVYRACTILRNEKYHHA